MSTDKEGDLIDALQAFEGAEREGIVFSRQAIAALCTRLTEAFNAAR